MPKKTQKKTPEEEAKAYHKRYYEEHKEKLKQDWLTPVKCPDCGKTVTKNNLLRHKKTKKHLAHVKNATAVDLSKISPEQVAKILQIVNLVATQ